MKLMERWDLRTLGSPIKRSPEYPKGIPKSWFREVVNSKGVGTTNVIGPVERFDATKHAFALRWFMMTTKKWEGKWGGKLKEIYEKRYLAPKEEDSKWGQVMNIASNQWHINCGPRNWKPAPINPEALKLIPEEMTAKIKNIALYFGGHLVGVCEIKGMEQFFYKKGRTYGSIHGSDEVPLEGEDPGREIKVNPYIPEYGEPPYKEHKYAIVIGLLGEDIRALKTQTGPANVTAVTIECSQQEIISLYMESCIRGLGYSAKAHNICGTEDLLQIPFAIKAGLGEMGRHNVMVTPWGSQVRLTTITTEMELIPDKPIDFGLQDFCVRCKKCARCCPSNALSMGKKRMIINGVERYPHNGFSCATYRFLNGCSTCTAVCPWTKPNNWLHNISRYLVTKSGFFREIFIKLDDLFYGKTPIPYPMNSKTAPWKLE